MVHYGNSYWRDFIVDIGTGKLINILLNDTDLVHRYFDDWGNPGLDRSGEQRDVVALDFIDSTNH